MDDQHRHLSPPSLTNNLTASVEDNRPPRSIRKAVLIRVETGLPVVEASALVTAVQSHSLNDGEEEYRIEVFPTLII